MTHAPSSRPRTTTPVTTALSLALLLSACATQPNGLFSSYSASCVAGGLLGAAVSEVLDRDKKKPSRERRKDLAAAAATGCALGLAATAIGKMMTAQQQAVHEAAMQKEARRRALEQQQYATTVQRLQAQPAATPQRRSARDAELARARAAYEESLSRPVEVSLGNGGTSTITVQAPPPGAAAPAAGGGSCIDYAVLVETSAGQARQFETWCPDAGGQMVRSEWRAVPAA